MVTESKDSERSEVSCLYGNSSELDEMYLGRAGVDVTKVAKVRTLRDKFNASTKEVKKACVAELERRYREGVEW
jgi:hypothetical protein